MKNLKYYLNLKYPFAVVPYQDDCLKGYRAYYLDIPAIESIGETVEEVVTDIADVKTEWIQFALNENISIPEPHEDYPKEEAFSGRVTLRLAKSLHKKAVENAQCEGLTLNSYLNSIIQEGMNSASNKEILEEVSSLRKLISSKNFLLRSAENTQPVGFVPEFKQFVELLPMQDSSGTTLQKNP